MRHRFVQYWPVLWQQFGVRPMDVDTYTLTEVMALEQAVDEILRSQR